MVEGAVAVMPPAKVKVSPDELPRVNVPELLKVVALVIESAAPEKERL